MSSPRVLRIVVTMPASDKRRWNSRIRSRAICRSRNWERIERDQVQLAGHLLRHLDQRFGVFGLVVDAIKHHVFESDEVARRKFEVAVAGGEQFLERITLVDRHQHVSRSASVGACRLTASATGTTRASSSICGTMPEVDTVTRRRDRP